ncbi:hypothetical protein SCLCIDRAFT_28483 [Scleroderma citrinum Foug A]|uniref:Uncharacterized protein n=1 Tax=Scleroderma citrinum Foug A TaxID=1036808 RepID=A0A0C3DB69_9AGAM|nr:hypothetical protein SCLCIDRAFT_28483 [Scleroderma citrinum Foug A]
METVTRNITHDIEGLIYCTDLTTRVHAPTLRHVGPSLDEELLELLPAPPSQHWAGVQPSTPFMYQPTQRLSRSRSASLDLERSTITPPFTPPVIFSPETIRDRPLRRPHLQATTQTASNQPKDLNHLISSLWRNLP